MSTLGEVGQTFYIILDGLVKVYINDPVWKEKNEKMVKK